ncbi:MAG: hypothetical protein H8E17_01525 [Deltaproteobacteria bacterium]|nr:hypothetical protein [Deltaproteobacteria bacterium]
MVSSLRGDEKFVNEALCSSYGGTWRIGEDPPDAYISLTENEVAVEISILTQHVVSKSGKPVPRLSQDNGVRRLCDEINAELKNDIPSGVYVLLTISSPLNKIRQTKTDLINEIKGIAQKKAPNKQVLENNQNKVKIQLILGDRPSGKKVVGIVPNQNSNSDILANVLYILSERINDKVTKCRDIVHRPLWLALFNDYWLAEPETYELAMKKLSVTHSFNKICLVLGCKEVHTLYET